PMTGIGLKADDRVISVHMTDEKNEDVLFVTRKGLTLRYPVDTINNTGVKAQGVRAMNLKEDDQTIAAELVSAQTHLVTVSQRGAIKRTALKTVPTGSRAQTGNMLLKEIKSKPHRLLSAAIIN